MRPINPFAKFIFLAMITVQCLSQERIIDLSQIDSKLKESTFMAIRFSQSEWDRAIRNATPISWDIPLEQSILAWKTSGGVIATWSCKLCWYIRPTGIDNDFTFEGCPCPGRGSGGGNGGGSVPDTLQNLKWCDSKFAYSKKNGFGCSGRCKEGMECKLVFREHSSGIFQLACQCIMQLPDLTINDAVPKPFYIDWPNKKVVANIINKGNAPAGPFRVYLEISKYDATRRPESQSEEYFSELEVGEARRIVIPLNKFSPPINISQLTEALYEVRIDAKNEVKESNESNNYFSRITSPE